MKAFSSCTRLPSACTIQSGQVAIATLGEKDKIWAQKGVLQQIITTQDEFNMSDAIIQVV